MNVTQKSSPTWQFKTNQEKFSLIKDVFNVPDSSWEKGIFFKEALPPLRIWYRFDLGIIGRHTFFSDLIFELLAETIFHPALHDNTFRARPWLKGNLVNSFTWECIQGGDAKLSQAWDASHAVATFSLLSTSGRLACQTCKKQRRKMQGHCST